VKNRDIPIRHFAVFFPVGILVFIAILFLAAPLRSFWLNIYSGLMASCVLLLMLGKYLYQFDGALLQKIGLVFASTGFLIGGFFVGVAFFLGLSVPH
jgi:hypothetical protein